MQNIKSICIYCGCGCNLNFYLKNGKIEKILPDKADPVSEGKSCMKGLTINEVVGKGRIISPMIRKSKKLKKVSWEEAYKYIYKNTKDLEPDEIFFSPSGKITNEDNFIMQKFARIVFGTNNIDSCCSRICHQATVQGLRNIFGNPANPWRFDEIYDRDCMLIIGSNPASNYPVLFNKILLMKEKGMKILSVQPIINLTSKYADENLLVYPGTEVVLLNGIMNFLVEQKAYEKGVENIDGFKELSNLVKEYSIEKVCDICKIKQEQFIKFAEVVANSKSLGIIHGMGLTQHVNAIENIHSLLNLLLLKGGKLLSCRGEVNVQGVDDMACSPVMLPVDGMVNFTRLEKLWERKVTIKKGKSLLEAFLISPVKAAFISSFNPAQSLPNLNEVHKNLKKMFLVQMDCYFNLTSSFAKVILPTPLLIERFGTITNGERRVRLVRKVVDQKNAKPEWIIFKELSQYFGLAKHFNYKNEREIFREIVEVIPAYSMIDVDFVYEGNDGWADKEIKFKKFIPERFEGVEDVRSKKYPFLLITFRSQYHFLTGEATSKSKTLRKFKIDFCYISTDDARKLKLKDGDKVRVSSSSGSVVAKVKIDNTMPEGTVGMHFHSEKVLVNKLFPTKFDEETLTPNLKVVGVKIKKV
ncbi:MAG: molybdopterin-dependent oxidoreductase [Candidatus Aenigmarchaeota archaeon]|nr:molybdopterin-dependent oxidoreductase [Candidatus Aenigmarchaeota archaeon]